jgi:hypothetical protein
MTSAAGAAPTQSGRGSPSTLVARSLVTATRSLCSQAAARASTK